MTKLQRIIYNSAVFRFLQNRSKKIILPGFSGVPLYDVTNFFVRQIKKTSLTERAAAVSYNFIMAIPPICLFLFTLIPNLPFISKRSLKTQLHSLIIDIIPSHAYNKSVIQFVDEIINGSKIGLISFTFLLSLFFASNAVMGLMRSFNKDYIGFKKIKGLRQRWNEIKLTILLFGLLLICLILLLLQHIFLNLVVIKTKTVK